MGPVATKAGLCNKNGYKTQHPVDVILLLIHTNIIFYGNYCRRRYKTAWLCVV